jgi:hypothetical protein
MTVEWLEQQRQAGKSVDVTGALKQLAVNWAANGPDHAFEGFYRTAADAMVQGMAIAIADEMAEYERHAWVVPLGDRQVRVAPDRVVLTPDGLIHVQRIRTGRETESEAKKPIYALLRRGAEGQYRGRQIVVETYYLSTGKRVAVLPDNDNASLEKYADAISEIELGRFEPDPNPRRCPSCQCYFMCGG